MTADAEDQERIRQARERYEQLLDQLPQCTCTRIDVDLVDVSGCSYHNPLSPWNRAMTEVELADVVEWIAADLDRRAPFSGRSARISYHLRQFAAELREGL